MPTRLIPFPTTWMAFARLDNIPNKKAVEPHQRCPPPFRSLACDSFGAHNNARLRRFWMNSIEYEFRSATACYKAGNSTCLLKILGYDWLSTSFCRRLARNDGNLFAVHRFARKRALSCKRRWSSGTGGGHRHQREDGRKVETPVTGGHCKLQWKCDWLRVDGPGRGL